MKRSREPPEDLLPDATEPDAERVADPAVTSPPPSKISELDSAVEDNTLAMRCWLPPHKHPLSFRFYSDYEAHYHKFHTNRCLECYKNFPSDHLLGVHIEEIHDPLVRIKRDRGDHTYSCFVEGCQRKCLTHQKRRMHMIDKHMYPKNFFFAVTKEGIDGRRSLLVEGSQHRRRSSMSAQSKEPCRQASTLRESHTAHNTGPTLPDTSDAKSAPDKKEAVDADMTDLAGGLSALQLVPSSVRFGRGRAGFAKS